MFQNILSFLEQRVNQSHHKNRVPNTRMVHLARFLLELMSLSGFVMSSQNPSFMFLD